MLPETLPPKARLTSHSQIQLMALTTQMELPMELPMDKPSRRRLLMHHKWQRRWAWQSLGLHVCIWLGAAITPGVCIGVAPQHYHGLGQHTAPHILAMDKWFCFQDSLCLPCLRDKAAHTFKVLTLTNHLGPATHMLLTPTPSPRRWCQLFY